MEIAEHFRQIVEELKRGRVIPFLGAGVNLCGHPRTPGDAECWKKSGMLPSGAELSRHLAQRFSYADAQTNWDLMRVSQFASVMEGNGPLYEELQQLFARDYPPTPLHTLLANVPRMLREKGSKAGLPLIITTNYDEVLETAFDAADEPFDLVCYFVEREGHRGKFWHLPDASTHFRAARAAGAAMESAPWVLIAQPNTYADFPVRQRTIILKIHGAVDRASVEHSSFVITEDDYIDYLSRMDFANPLPKKLQELMKYARYLFLGYGLRDWNLRVVLQRIWGEQRLTYQSWAIQLGPQDIDRKSWAMRKVEILDMRLEDYAPQLAEGIEKTAPMEAEKT
jgi:phosphoglycolate phosphatase-like HAD superfamily hydrolase